MPEIIIHQIAFGTDGSPANLDRGIELPIDNETLDKTMMCMKVKYPYIAHSYTFGLNELNVQITGAQPLDKLNSLAARLTELSEYERVKLEGAVLLTDCKTPEDCVKLMHNLDSFELTPNVSDYGALGRYFAANDFADSLAAVPADMMEHFDYDLLGRMGWDDHTNVFVKGHHVWDAEHELNEPDLTREPNSAYLKLRFVSDNNPDGVWLKFPLSGAEAIDAPEQSDEMAVALKSLGVQSIEDARLKGCESRYPVLTKCVEYSEGGTLSDLIWKAHKSTLLYNVSGMDRATSGSVNFCGTELASMLEDSLSALRLQKMGFVFQQSNLLKNLNILDNIILSAFKAKNESRNTIVERAKRLMEQTGISALANNDITQASGGQLQRVAICRALINNPQILFGDEPTGALNSKATSEVMDILAEINRAGTTILLVTHDAKVAAKTERVLFMMDGNIVYEKILGKYQKEKDDVQERECQLSAWLLQMGLRLITRPCKWA